MPVCRRLEPCAEAPASCARGWAGPGGRARSRPPRRTASPTSGRPEASPAATSKRWSGWPVRDLDLYEHALRHRSLFRGSATDGTESNERLEFLGDAVLGAIVAEILYRRFPDRAEGLLTRTRATLVNGKALAGYAETIGLGGLVLMSENMEGSDGRRNATILADAFEAVVGAVYLDLGFTASRRFVQAVLDRCVDLDVAAADKSNHKSRLLEHVQGLGLEQPIYQTLSEEGPSHDRTFTVAVLVDGRPMGEGVDRSKKGAEQVAARLALLAMRGARDGAGVGGSGFDGPRRRGPRRPPVAALHATPSRSRPPRPRRPPAPPDPPHWRPPWTRPETEPAGPPHWRPPSAVPEDEPHADRPPPAGATLNSR